jgi:thymidylate synthase (FAD)
VTTLSVLDHGLVELLDSTGDDLRVVQAAQASFNRSSEEYGDRERGILRTLMREEHGVPFEHVTMTFRVKMPLFLAAQFKKHRMSSWSEHSGRYSKMEREFYIPSAETVRRQIGKAMDYEFEQVPEHMAVSFRQDLREMSNRAFNLYERWTEYGVAKEQARLILPVNTYTTVVWTMNARALFNFLRLRLDGHAQGEAREYALAMEELAASVIPDTMAAFREFGMPRP